MNVAAEQLRRRARLLGASRARTSAGSLVDLGRTVPPMPTMSGPAAQSAAHAPTACAFLAA